MPGLRWDIQYHIQPYFLFLCLQLTKSDTKLQVKWADCLVITDIIATTKYNIPQEVVKVCMG